MGKCQAKWQDRCYILWVDPMSFSRDLFGLPVKRNVPMIILIVGIDTNHKNLRHKKRRIPDIFVVTTTRFELLKSSRIAVLPGISADLCRLVSVSVP